MFRQQIFDALKAKFTGVSDAILSRVAEKLDKTVTSQEQVATVVEGVTFQQVLESYGDSRATEAQQTAVRNYEQKYGLKDGVKAEKTGGQQPQATDAARTTTQGGGDETPSWAKALIDSNKALTERLNAMEGERTNATRRQKLANITDKLPEALRKAYERTPVENITDDEFNSLISEISTEVQGIMSETNARGAVFGRPSASNGRQGQKEELSQEQIAAISKREGSSPEQQPF